MKQIIVDANSNVFCFNGKTMDALGWAVPFKELPGGVIFQIGRNIYLKKGKEFELWMPDATTYEFGSDDSFAKKQLETIGGQVLFIEMGRSGFLPLPERLGAVFRDMQQRLAAQERAFIIETGNIQTGKHYKICVTDEKGYPSVYAEDLVANNECGMSFAWSGGGYVLKDNRFVRMPWRVLYHRSADYIILLLENFVYALFENGEVRALNSYVAVKRTPIADILVTESAGGNECWHLGDDFVEKIVYSPMDDDCMINPDGTIVHSYVLIQNGEEFDSSSKYDLVNGHYTVVEQG